jgi:lysyl-tRNA synthetase class I
MMGLWLRATGQTLLEREEEQQAMNTEKDVIERRIANRVSMAIRWHKLTKEEQVSRFVRNDPEIQAILNGETLQEEMLHHMLTKLVDQVFEAEDVVARDLEQRLPRLRRQFGDKLVDLILEIITEQEGS